MLGHYTTGPVSAVNSTESAESARAVGQGAFGKAQRLAERLLAQGQREVAARLFKNATRAVRGPAETAGQRVRVVNRDQQAVDIVHGAQDRLTAVQLAPPEQVQHVAPQLADRLGKPIQERRRGD